MRAWARECWNALADHTADRLPVVLVRRSTMHEHERNAFLLGVDAGGYGLIKPSPTSAFAPTSQEA
ncbi:hypothetical protein ENKNEFLB_02839 [Nocardioides aquaticus]|uniref:Uncharacterized protein n=1 Tax=Nocardioides aquaticus TaxID=160826 RepID=A0ABX8EIW8_9ACTN|nr:hypothetical protein [Nocardioides aquaticus]QVT80444.1 hypothetical protein ENKNEFLB_02839 [Nocardioides aquaticus]